MTDQETERALRARVVALQDELRKLTAQAAGLFRTSGWIRTADEPPSVGLRALGASDDAFGWYERQDNGKWMHNYMNGHICEEPWGPEFWMLLPKVPE